MTAATTEALHPRVALLLRLVRRQGGEWTTARVARAYAKARYDAPQRHTHRHDLDLLWRMGVLDRRETTGRRWYVPSRVTTEQRGTS
jgi:hypothetical protein